MSTLGYLAALALAGYLVFALLLYTQQSRMVFSPELPGREIETTPGEYGMDYDRVVFRTTDGEHLVGWYVPVAKPRATLLLHHGNAGNISHRLESVRLFHGLGLAVFIFDYRGYGESSGSPGETGTYRDAEAAWRYLTETRGIAPEEIVIFGRSLGAAVAAHLARDHAPRALILESTFTSVPDLGAEHYPWLPVRMFARIRYETRATLTAIHTPLLIVHSRDDDLIPFQHGERLFAAANEPKQFLAINGNHNDGFLVSGERYRQGIARFLDSWLEDATMARP